MAGRVAWNKGLTKETDKRLVKISETKKGYSTWNKGLTKETDERIANLSKILTGRTHSEEHNRNMGIAKKGKKYPKELYPNFGGRGKTCWNKGLTKETNASLKKQSEAMENRPFSEIHKRKISEACENRFGAKNPNWRDGLSFLPYPDKFNKQLKELIRARDNYKCQLCGMPECENIKKLSVHHVDYDKENCLPSNLISLCNKDNCRVNRNREHWQKYFNKILIKKGDE